MTATLRCVLVRRPPDEMGSADPALWNYASAVDLNRARSDHAELVRVLLAQNVDVATLEERAEILSDSVFTHDPSLVTREGAVIMRMGKSLRRPESELHESAYRRLGIPIIGRIEAPATMEAGDALWLDERTLFVGRGHRTNDEGIRQIAGLLGPLGIDVIPVDLPGSHDPRSCLHLLSLISPLADDLAMVHLAELPHRLRDTLLARGVELLDAPAREFAASATLSANILALAPRRCLMIEGYPDTVRLLESRGCEVVTFRGVDLCLKTEGGPTCLTRPILRD